MATLKRLHVKNLGPIELATLDDRAPVTLLLGPNEAGKSTILEAPAVLYFGTRGDVPVGENRKLTRDGAKGWSVELTVGDRELSATRSQRPLQEECRAALGDPRVFRSLTHLQAFIDLKPSERKMLLADLNARDTDALLEKLEAAEAPPTVIDAVRLGNMKRAHAEAVDVRRSASRKLKSAQHDAEREIPDEEVETKRGTYRVSDLPLDTIEASLQRLRSRRDKALQATSERRRLQAILDAGEKARADLENLEAKASWSSGDETRLLEVGRALDDLRKRAGEASAEIAVASKAHECLQGLVRDGAGACPTCTRSFEEGEAEAALENVNQESGATITRCRRVQEECAEKAKELGEEQKRLARRKAQAEASATYKRRLQEAVAAAEAAEVPEEPPQAPAELDTELQRVGAMRDKRRDYELNLRNRDSAREKLPELQARVDALEKIEVLTDPAAMADEDSVLRQFNGLLKRTTGKLGAPVEVSAGYEVTIQGRDAGLASDSARIRAGFGIACALSVVAGVGLALLDRFESLDESNRKRALGMVKGLVDDGLLDSVLIAAVKDDPKRSADVPWLAWVKVANGTAEYL